MDLLTGGGDEEKAPAVPRQRTPFRDPAPPSKALIAIDLYTTPLEFQHLGPKPLPRVRLGPCWVMRVVCSRTAMFEISRA
jgi:hypothetical protein